MPSIVEPPLPEARYTYGGDEFIFCEIAEGMTFGANFSTRVIDVPAYYDDPWTREVLMRFRDQHQAPEGTDLEYVTRINGFKTEQEFIEAHHGSPYYVSMVGFVLGMP